MVSTAGAGVGFAQEVGVAREGEARPFESGGALLVGVMWGDGLGGGEVDDDQLLQLVRSLEREKILGGNAARFYGLSW